MVEIKIRGSRIIFIFGGGGLIDLLWCRSSLYIISWKNVTYKGTWKIKLGLKRWVFWVKISNYVYGNWNFFLPDVGLVSYNLFKSAWIEASWRCLLYPRARKIEKKKLYINSNIARFFLQSVFSEIRIRTWVQVVLAGKHLNSFPDSDLRKYWF